MITTAGVTVELTSSELDFICMLAERRYEFLKDTEIELQLSKDELEDVNIEKAKCTNLLNKFRKFV